MKNTLTQEQLSELIKKLLEKFENDGYLGLIEDEAILKSVLQEIEKMGAENV